jgi:5'-nucleotidase
MILLINDDGIDAPGLRALYRALRKHTGKQVLAVAPTHERSGQSHAITIDRGLAVTARNEDGFFGFSVDGTPTDCAKLALSVLCHRDPDLVVSGINDGPNVGRSIFYSGTVGAALEAAVLGFPALAVSRDRGGEGFEDAADFAAQWAARLLGRDDFRNQVVNLNLPGGAASSWKEPRLVDHGHSGFRETYQPQRDGKDRVLWRLHGEWVAKPDGEPTDATLLSAGHPTFTVLAPNLNTSRSSLEKLVKHGGRAKPPAGARQ